MCMSKRVAYLSINQVSIELHLRLNISIVVKIETNGFELMI